MSKRNSTVEIKEGKVVFSQEIINYFKNLRNEENSKWINKYFNVLSDERNLNAEKFEIHHIRPCFTFKDKEHKTRKETEMLSDEFNGNSIKLSIYNHLFAHYYLWKIFNNQNSKVAFQRMCGQRINNLTENELKEIARLKEECTKKNQTEEEFKKYQKEWIENNKEHFSEYQHNYNKEHKKERNKKSKERYENNKERILKQHKEYYECNKEEILKQRKEHRENNKEEILQKDKKRFSRLCYDPIEKEPCSYSALKNRKQRHKEKYKDVILKDCIIQPQPQS